MANLTPAISFDPVYQLETVDDVLGGAAQISNWQAQALTNRDEFLYDIIVPKVAPNIVSTPTTFTNADANKTQELTGFQQTHTLPDITLFPLRSMIVLRNLSESYLDIQPHGPQQINDKTCDIVGPLPTVRMYPNETLMLVNYGVTNTWDVVFWLGRVPPGQITSQCSPGIGAAVSLNNVACDGSVYSGADYRYARLFQAIGKKYDHTQTGANFMVPTLGHYVDGGPDSQFIYYVINL